MISLQHKSDWFFTVLWKKEKKSKQTKKTPSWWIVLRETQERVVLWLLGEAVAAAHLSCCLLLPKPSAFSLASREKLPTNSVVPTRNHELWRKQSKGSSGRGAEQCLAGVSRAPPAARLCAQPWPDASRSSRGTRLPSLLPLSFFSLLQIFITLSRVREWGNELFVSRKDKNFALEKCGSLHGGALAAVRMQEICFIFTSWFLAEYCPRTDPFSSTLMQGVFK